MKNGLVISDSGPIFSLALVNKLDLLDELFDEVSIPNAVWQELTKDHTTEYYDKIVEYFENRIKEISGSNKLTFVMDYGESEAVILYNELKAHFLLIDDKKARDIAENLGINCIGTIAVLSTAHEKGLVSELRPLFLSFLKNKRFYSLNLLNMILKKHNEIEIEF